MQRLFIHDNPVADFLPAEVLGPTWNEFDQGATPADPAKLLAYYYQVEQDSRPLNEAKLILVGRGGVGKTSLVKRLIDGTFDKGEAKTDGINIRPWPVTLGPEDDVTLHVWDFGGQEIMHSTHQFFLTARSLYVLVLSGREGNEDRDAEYWLRLIASFGSDAPVIVVLNKIKEMPFNVNRRGLQREYHGIREFVHTDCDDGTGIKELETIIHRETGRLHNLRAKFPTAWFAIKNKLSKSKKNYLTYEKYRAFCKRNKVTNPSGQDTLAGFLHDLGIALNYRDDPRLRDTHVLNPHWVTAGVYTILNAPLLAQQQGKLHLNDLSTILKEKNYPREMHQFLINLMRKFELCFPFPDENEPTYLVPELLDKEEPESVGEFDPEGCLNFQYRYPVLPEGLLPRFTVRTHVMSEDHFRWRTGVILGFDRHRALVRADATDNIISMMVDGPLEGRRHLLAIIRSNFEHIHRQISKLNPKELVPVPNYPEVVIPYQKLCVLEEKGVTELHEVYDNEVITLNVLDLLNGVDLSGQRSRRDKPTSAQLRLFISYSRKDDRYREELKSHLTLMQRQGIIDTWYDQLTPAGKKWEAEIAQHLAEDEIIVMLISADFISSHYCYVNEMEQALRRHDAGQACVIPVLIRKCDYKGAPFAKLQMLPDHANPIAKSSDKDSAWTRVAEEIRKAAERLIAERQQIT